MLNKIFWLHIKKCGGTSTKNILKKYNLYLPLASNKFAPSFIQSDKKNWNSILNNSRIYLGEYNFKRALFAKKYLFHNEWNSIYKFSFVRNPYERVISCFYYLYAKSNNFAYLEKGCNMNNFYILKLLLLKKFSASYIFDYFLELVAFSLKNQNCPTKHFSAHVARYYDDITDYSGQILLNDLFDIDNFVRSFKIIFNNLEIKNESFLNEKLIYNKNEDKNLFTLSKSQKLKIERIYEKDFDIYESLKKH